MKLKTTRVNKLRPGMIFGWKSPGVEWSALCLSNIQIEHKGKSRVMYLDCSIKGEIQTSCWYDFEIVYVFISV